MKICFLIHSITSGGAERTVSYLCNNFVNREGCNVDLVQYGHNKPFYNLDKKINIFDITTGYNQKNIIIKFFNKILRYVKFNIYCKKEKPDIIFCMLYKSYGVASFLNKNIPIVISERNDPSQVSGKKAIKKRKQYFNKADGIIFQTFRAREFYQNNVLMDVNKGIVIQNAIGNTYAYTIDAIKTFKTNKISAIGRLNEQKNYPLLIKSFVNIHNTHPSYILEIFGTGAEKDYLEQLAKEEGVSDFVIFRGTSPDALRQIADSKCYVMSSNYEGMPNSLMEAMAIGLPCVSTDCPNGPAELIKDGENGLLVPVGDEKALTKAILRMIDDDCFAYSCAKNAKKILETNNIDVISQKFYDYIIEISNK